MNLIKKYPFEFIFTALAVLLSVVLNCQFLNASNINYLIAGHDEYIAVKEVYSILAPASLKHFLMAIISGNALYYGRIMFYLDALFAYLPFLIWGIKGMVLSIRLFHSFLLITSLLLLAFTFLNNAWHRAAFLIASFCVFYSMYFMMMPKPEPHQMLFLALFFNRFKRSEWNFGKHFVYLGIAYGLKFNILLLLPFLFLLPLLVHPIKGIKHLVFKGSLSFAAFLLGIVIAIPCLALSVLKPIFLQTYLHDTFQNTTKYYDNVSLSFQEWMASGFGGNYFGIDSLSYVFVVFALYMLLKNLRTANRRKHIAAIILILSGLMLILIIMLKTKRLWPHYLWTGYILTLLGICTSLNNDEISLSSKIETFVLYVLIMCSTFFYFKRDLPIMINLESSPEMLQIRNWNDSALAYVNARYHGKTIGTDGTVAYPFENFVAVNRYNPFKEKLKDLSETKIYWYKDAPEKIWENDVLMFYKRNPERIQLGLDKAVVPNTKELYDLYLEMTKSKFKRDTAFGEVVIFKKR